MSIVPFESVPTQDKKRLVEGAPEGYRPAHFQAVAADGPPGGVAHFEGYRYLALETRRRNGTTVVTPMCFVIQDNKLYLRTNLASGKIKRLRHTSQVRLAPCNPGGKPLADWVSGDVTVYGVGEMPWVYGLFKRKYRLEQRLIDVMIRWRGLTYVVLAVQLQPPAP